MDSFKLLDSYFFTVLPVENGYLLRVDSGGKEYTWPSMYISFEAVGKEILWALTTASECRGEIKKHPPASNPDEGDNFGPDSRIPPSFQWAS